MSSSEARGAVPRPVESGVIFGQGAETGEQPQIRHAIVVPDIDNARVARGRIEVTLGSNPAFEALAERLRTTQPAWRKVFRNARRDHRMIPSQHDRGFLGALHVKHVIAQAASTDFSGSINIDPIADGAESRSYRFRRNTLGGTDAFHKGRREVEAEYDALFLVEDLPVVCEVKITNRRNRNIGGGYAPALDAETVTNKFKPLQEHYDTEGPFGYMVVSLPHVINLEAEREQQFMQRGGIIVALPTTLEEFDSKTAEFQASLAQSARDRRS